MTPAPHDPALLDKIASCACERELDALRDAFKARHEEPAAEAVQAIARRRVELRRGKR